MCQRALGLLRESSLLAWRIVALQGRGITDQSELLGSRGVGAKTSSVSRSIPRRRSSKGPREKMEWLSHPVYVKTRDSLCEKLSEKTKSSFRRHPNFVFLCGGNSGSRRDHIEAIVRDYLEGEVPFRVFRAENIWEELREQKGGALDLFVMERYIGEISDIVIIIVESPGTFAELGAFVTDDNLKDKLLIILDESFREHNSFINDGPVSYFDQRTKSPYRPAIHTDFSLITKCKAEIVERLGNAPRQKRLNIQNFGDYGKLRFLYVLDLVALLGPVSLEHIHWFAKNIGIETKLRMVETLLSLGVSLGFIDSITHKEDHRRRYYYSRAFVRNDATHHISRGIDFIAERAKLVGVLQRIPVAREVLAQVKEAG